MESESLKGKFKTMADGRKPQDKKRKRWEDKQARRQDDRDRDTARRKWISENAHYCSQITFEDVLRAKSKSSTSSGSLNALLRPYVDLKDAPQKVDSIDETLFIAEGTETVRLLIQQSVKEPVLKVKSVFVKPATLFEPPVQLLHDIECASDELHADATELPRPPFHLLVANEHVMSEAAGFPISRGALACGIVPKRDEAWLNEFLSTKLNDRNAPLRLLALDGICDSSNMGAMIRCAAAFEIDAMILSRDCCDAWYRRSVRVSMGHIFRVPIARVDDLASTLHRLLAEHTRVVAYAAVIDEDADLVLERIQRGDVSRSWCCVMGNEAHGISQPVVDECTHRLRIDIADGVDSLSVPIATGILLHGMKERECAVLDDR